MINKQLALAGGAALALGTLSPAAQAALEDRFDYFQLQGTTTGEFDSPAGTVDVEEGISLEAAKSANDIVFFRGTIDTYNVEGPGGTEGGVDFLSFGPGVGLPLGMFHAWAQVSYERLNFLGNVGNGPGVEVGATIGDIDGVRLGVTARRGEPDFSGTEDIDYDLYQVDGMIPVADRTDLVVSYQEGTLETPGGDTDLDEVFSLGVRFGF